MRTRPWPLVILAIIQVYTPLITIFFNAWVHKVSPSRVMGWMLDLPLLEAFYSLALMPLAGFAIWAMKSWSYPVFFAAIAWSAGRNIMNWNYASSVMPVPATLGIYLFELLLVGYLLLPKVRRTYFDPSVRWWESKPRYQLELEAKARKGGRAHDVSIMNISEGGAFVSSTSKLNEGNELEISFSILGRPFDVKGEIVHSRELPNGSTCYGVRFAHTRATQQKLHSLTDALRNLGFQDSARNQNWNESLKTWLATLVKTGQGLIPEPQFRADKKKKRA